MGTVVQPPRASSSAAMAAVRPAEGRLSSGSFEAALPSVTAELPGAAPVDSGAVRAPNEGVILRSDVPLEDLEPFDPGDSVLPQASPDFEAPVVSKPPRMVRFTPQPMEAVTVPEPAPPPPSIPQAPAEFTFPEVAYVEEPATSPPPPSAAPSFDPRPGIVAFAGFGIAPDKLSEMPSYALHVLARKRILRAGLEIARDHRPRDVELYEAALLVADAAALQKGLALLGALGIVALATLITVVGLLF